MPAMLWRTAHNAIAHRADTDLRTKNGRNPTHQTRSQDSRETRSQDSRTEHSDRALSPLTT